MSSLIEDLERDLQAPVEVRRFGSGWLSGFLGLVLSVAGLCLVASLRWPDWFSTPELEPLRAWSGFRLIVHLVLIGGYALALLSLLLRPRKAIGTAALLVALTATLLGGSAVQPRETADWGIFFGI